MKISYAQNFEDVMLYRALGDQPSGFYVDVGAHDPAEFSVTKFFYDRGWRGINVEPVGQYHAALVDQRPDDINLNVAAGSAHGAQEMFVVPDTGLSTFLKEHADVAAERGFAVATSVVPVLTLDEICDRVEVPAIHFLKIDVEGAEGDVLRGMSFTRTRPWIVVVEATRPGTQELAFADWEPMLVDAGYAFVYFDGLNRFYVAREHAELGDAFAVPPNVFDSFMPARQYALEVRAHALEVQLKDAAVGADSLRAEIVVLTGRFAAERASLDDALQRARGEAAHQGRRADDLDVRLQVTAAELERLVVLRDAIVGENIGLRAALAEHDATVSENARLRAALAERDGEATQQRQNAVALHARLEATGAELERVVAARDELYEAHMGLRADFERQSTRLNDTLASLMGLRADFERQSTRLNDALATLRAGSIALAGSQDAVQRLERELQSARASVDDLERRQSESLASIDALHASRSWRVTAPLRAITRWIAPRN